MSYRRGPKPGGSQYRDPAADWRIRARLACAKHLADLEREHLERPAEASVPPGYPKLIIPDIVSGSGCALDTGGGDLFPREYDEMRVRDRLKRAEMARDNAQS